MNTSRKSFVFAFNLESKLYKAIRLYLLISKVFCVTPIDIGEDFLLNWNSWKILFHILWYIAVYITIATSVYVEYSFFNISLPNIQKPLFLSEYLVYLIHVLLIMAVGYKKHSSIPRIIESIVSIDQKLMKFGIKPNYNRLRKFSLIHLLLLAIYAAISVILNYYYGRRETIGVLRSLTVYALPNLIIGFSIMQYYQLMYAIYLRCQSLVEAMEDFHSKYNLFPFKIIIRSFSILYSTLEILTKEVNSVLSYTVLLIYCGSYLNISINIFLIYQNSNQKNEINIVLLMYSIAWVAMHAGKMFLILYMQKITLILGNVQPENVQMELMIRRFLLQLMVNTRSHVVCNIMDLNLSFVTSLLVNTSVLVIFLIQYDVTFEALTNTHSSA
ncbi:putative gustatory receptor 59f [Eupeodes corollae]|uniref:putative gustatory receptor 59f n=1 Tax=Eupeodes corollae TaxID=290404 RepID=UPI002493608E|nr:putative gustatory receptor 59f [Eupeodes corollae]